MLEPVLDLFELVPDHDLHLMTPNQTLAGLTSQLITSTSAVVKEERPDWVIAQGDTTTALGAGLAAFYEGARVAHVEAGLRTSDRRCPFPEEANRRMVDLLSVRGLSRGLPRDMGASSIGRAARLPRFRHGTLARCD